MTTNAQTIAISLLKTARPRQWVKNLSLFAALFFAGYLFIPTYFYAVFWAFLIFTLATSSVYIVNDIIDAPGDRRHPFKKKRPIASRQLPIPVAVFAAIVGFTASLFLAWNLNIFLFSIVLFYTLLHFGYTFWFKHVPILDVLTIATGFVLRVYAGAAVVNLHMSVWFLFTVVSLALFMAVGKRQSDRTLIQGVVGSLHGQRNTLTSYTGRLLDIYTGMFANATWLTYALFTFQNEFARPDERFGSLFAVLPKTLHTQKLLMLTLPFVIFGVMRYLQLVYEDNEGESPELVLLRDKLLLTTVFAFGASVMIIIYGLS